MGRPWTAHATLPGGEFPNADFDAWFEEFRASISWLPTEIAHGYARRYGSRAGALLGDARSLSDLGRRFGDGLYELEARYLIAEEWATTAEDILMRRTKHALHMSESRMRGLRGLDGERRALNKPRPRFPAGSRRTFRRRHVLIRSTCRTGSRAPAPKSTNCRASIRAGAPVANAGPGGQKFGLSPMTVICAGTTDGCASFLATGASEIGDAVTALGSTLVIKQLSDRPINAPDYGVYSHGSASYGWREARRIPAAK